MDSISSLKLADLKRELRARNLPITGTKQILVDRLLEAMSAEKSSNDDSNIDDLLDEDSMLGEEESDGDGDATDNVAADLTISSPTATIPPVTLSSPVKVAEAVKRSASSPLKTEQNGNSTSQDAPPSKKKIILNRQPVPEAAPQILGGGDGTTAEAIKAAAENKPPVTDSKGEKAVIKISEVTAPVTDKLKLRQVKFGAAAAEPAGPIVPTADIPDRLKKRAERFGIAGGVSAAGKVSLTTEDEAKLAKRRERFGVVADEKVDEMKQKRAARFGGITSKPSTESVAEVDEKKSKRAARFAAAL